MTVDLTTLENVLVTTAYPASEREEVLAAMGTMLAGQGLRATYVHPLPDLVESEAGAEARARFDSAIQPLPTRAPFAFLPIPELVTHLGVAADALDYRDDLRAACNHVMARHIASMRQHSSLKLMLEAGGDGLFDYLDLVSSSAPHFYNFGTRTNHRMNRRHMVIEFDGYSPTLSVYWVIGLNEGLLSLFKRPGRVRFERGGHEMSFALHIELD